LLNHQILCKKLRSCTGANSFQAVLATFDESPEEEIETENIGSDKFILTQEDHELNSLVQE
jgi:hypothetical protein